MSVENISNIRASHLPPREYWLYDPEKHGLLPTPLDERGLVDAITTVATAVAAIDPAYEWRSDLGSDIHHLYWPDSDYLDLPDADINPHKYRELPINQIIINRELHSVIHTIMAPPAIPESGTMKERMQVNEIIRRLGGFAGQSIKLDRLRWIEQERLVRGREYNLFQFLVEVEESKDFLSEHSIDIAHFDPDTTKDLHDLAISLGKIANRANYTRAIKNGEFLGKYALSSFAPTDATLVV